MKQFFLHQFIEKPKISPLKNDGLGTKTITETRENQDTDRNLISPFIPNNVGLDKSQFLGTMTKTSTREEPDQDPSSRMSPIVPNAYNFSNTGTKTMTKSREEPDTDFYQKNGFVSNEG